MVIVLGGLEQTYVHKIFSCLLLFGVAKVSVGTVVLFLMAVLYLSQFAQ